MHREAESLQFKSDYARRIAIQEDAAERDLHIKSRRLEGSLGGGGINSLRRTDSERVFSSNRDGLFRSRFVSNMSGSIGCLPGEVDHDVEQWVSSTLFRDILDVKERTMQAHQQQSATLSSRPLPGPSLPANEISRVETVVSINKDESSSPHCSMLPANDKLKKNTSNEESFIFNHWSALPTNEISKVETVVSINKESSSSPRQLEELQRENQQLRRQLSNLESGMNREDVRGREGFQELQLEVGKLHNKIEKMESSKELYETSTQRLVTFLEAFTSHLSVTSPKPVVSPKLKRLSACGNINLPRWGLEESGESCGALSTEMDKRSSIGSYTSSGTSGYSTLRSRRQNSNPNVARKGSFRTLLGTKSLWGSDINNTSIGVNRRQIIRNKQPKQYNLPSARPRIMMGSNSFVSRRSSFNSRSRRGMSTADLSIKAGGEIFSDDFNNDHLRDEGQQPIYGHSGQQPIYGHRLSFSSGLSVSSAASDDLDVDPLNCTDNKCLSKSKSTAELGSSFHGKSQLKDESKVKKLLNHVKYLWSKENLVKSVESTQMDISRVLEVKDSKVIGDSDGTDS